MLEKLIVILHDSQNPAGIIKMKDNLGKSGIKVEILEEAAAQDMVYKKEEKSLYLTDSTTVYRLFHARNIEMTVLLHEQNKTEDFWGAIQAVSVPEELDKEDWNRIYLRMEGLPWTILETPRLILRETTVKDVEAFYDIYEEESITRYMEPLFEDREEEVNYTRDYIEKIYGFYGYGMWSVIKREDGAVIGRAGLSWREGFDMPELGFVISKAEQRKGYAYEICRAILRYGEEKLDFDLIQALVRRQNAASAKLCLKLGFILTDQVTDRGIEFDRYQYQSI